MSYAERHGENRRRAPGHQDRGAAESLHSQALRQFHRHVRCRAGLVVGCGDRDSAGRREHQREHRLLPRPQPDRAALARSRARPRFGYLAHRRAGREHRGQCDEQRSHGRASGHVDRGDQHQQAAQRCRCRRSSPCMSMRCSLDAGECHAATARTGNRSSWRRSSPSVLEAGTLDCKKPRCFGDADGCNLGAEVPVPEETSNLAAPSR